jgi:AcrR family transcriptional regulator
VCSPVDKTHSWGDVVEVYRSPDPRQTLNSRVYASHQYSGWRTVVKAVVKGKRELNKEEKLRRIRTAAIDLFTSKGYDDTTTREIAKRAKVAMGTVFVYAETKRDLLFLVINDDLDACIDRARHALQADRLSLFESLLLILRIHYEYFARKPIISRVALREMYFYDSGKQADRFHQTRDRLASLLRDLVASALDKKLIHSAESADCVSEAIFAIYQVHLRRWLEEDKLDVSDAMRSLGRQIRVVMSGLAPRPEALTQGRSGSKK